MIYAIIKRKYFTYLRLTSIQKTLVVKVLLLSITRMFYFAIGFRKWKTDFIAIQLKIEGTPSKEQIEIMKDIALAINIAGKYIFWRNLCRHQSWQAIYLLNYYKIPFNYFVGMKKNQAKKIEGHSWVMVNNQFVCGDCNIANYIIVNQHKF